MFIAQVSLREGKNTITCVARDDASGVGTASVQVSLDTTPPTAVIESPRNGLVTTEPTLTVVGAVNDMVTGTVNGEDVTVRCNNHQATVQNRTFVLANLSLRPGLNAIECVATDTAGNSAPSVPVQITRQDLAGQRIERVLGGDQSGLVGTELSQPLVVRLRDATGTPVTNRNVAFQVTRGSGTIRTPANTGRTFEVKTDASGQASVFFTLGDRASGQSTSFEALSFGDQVKLANPLAAYAFELEGADPHQVECNIPPAFSSAETAGEMVELYWQALTRDIPFSAYDAHPLTNTAAADLSTCSDCQGPKVNGAITPVTLFRGNTPGDLIGPYLSQFLWLDVPAGTLTTVQRNRVPVAGSDYLTTYSEWLNIQRGFPSTRVTAIDPIPRYLRNGRDLAEYVHKDFTYQAYWHACLILLAMRAPLKADNPYVRSLTQGGFVTFGAPHVFDLVARVANASLKAAWCHKWLVHRRLRPEEFAGRIHNQLTNKAQYPLHKEVLKANALSAVFRTYGSYLLPMAYSESCPTHPAYPAGHAAIAGAFTTVLKAFFNESFVIPNPMMANPDGLSLVSYKGNALTVGGELNKLASNIALGRNTAGVHWRSDGIEGLKLGEAVAIGILTDLRATCPEPFDGFSFTRFDGSTITI